MTQHCGRISLVEALFLGKVNGNSLRHGSLAPERETAIAQSGLGNAGHRDWKKKKRKERKKEKSREQENNLIVPSMKTMKRTERGKGEKPRILPLVVDARSMVSRFPRPDSRPLDTFLPPH